MLKVPADLIEADCSFRSSRCAAKSATWKPEVLNDVHSQLNPTIVADTIAVASSSDIVSSIHRANRENRWVSISGGRHAMGGQQFGTGAIHLDMRAFDQVLDFDDRRGTITVQAGIEWPKLIRDYHRLQRGKSELWGIVQKQTGADRLSIGGAVSANIHGRCLTARPFIQDVEGLTVVNADGDLVHCSREQNRELFRLVVGGYGLFGVVATVTIRLTRKQKVQRVVEELSVDQLIPAFFERIASGYLYGDFQFAIDADSPSFLRDGVFSCYRPVTTLDPIPLDQIRMSQNDWHELFYLAHVDKSRAFDRFRQFYRSTSGQVYWSDTHQAGYYLDDYHRELDQRLRSCHRATEVITELYVPRPALTSFMDSVRRELRQQKADLVYGTIRLIEADHESFLNWARDDFACVIFNLHTEHTTTGLAKSREQLRRLIDIAIDHHGSFYLTYHRHATPKQIATCYPQFAEFLRFKQQYDPRLRFQSEWYRHYASQFAQEF